MQRTIDICLRSHIGNSRDNQEDNFFVSPDIYAIPDVKDEQRLMPPHTDLIFSAHNTPALVAVSDGMGGHAHGEVAGYIVARALSEIFSRMPQCSDEFAREIHSSIVSVNRRLLVEARNHSELKGMGATLCGVAIFTDGTAVGFNVGDSRLYALRDGELTRISKDHTEGQRLLSLKLLTEEEVEQFKNRKSLYKYIGMSSDPTADIVEMGIMHDGDILLVCTDGLTDALSDAELAELLLKDRELDAMADELLSAALEKNKGFGDNITLALIKF